MDTVLITTDFSDASRHALDYAGNLLKSRSVVLDLLHVFEVPVTYTSDGVALAALGGGIERAEHLLQDEVSRIRAAWPEIQITGRIITGTFLETLRQEALLVRPKFIILGTAGFADLYLGDTDPLNALRMLPVPVLFVPQGAVFQPLHRVAYACNYRYAGANRTPVAAMTDWVNWIGAGLEVVHTDKEARGDDPRQTEGEAWLRTAFSGLEPAFRWIVDADVIHGLSSRLNDGDIDCVMAVPRRYGFWESLFHQSRTKALARMNRLPVIAFHEL